MHQKSQNYKTWQVTVQLLCGITMLLCGCSIYLLFRSKTINLYQWCSMVGLADVIDILRMGVMNWQVPDFIRFCLPDGLYCASYILLMDAVWPDNGKLRYLAVLFIPIVAIGHELLQCVGITKGTFDVSDLLCYIVPLAIYYYAKKKHLFINN